MSSHRLLNVTLAIVLIVLVGGTYIVTRDGDDPSSTSGLSTTTVQRGTVLATVSASATVEAPKDLGLNFTTAGKITSLDVKVGQKVKAGQIIGQVDDESSQQSLEEALANLSSAEATLANAQQGQTRAEAASAAAMVATARAQVQSARSALSNDRAVSAANAAQYQQQIQAAERNLDSANERLASHQAQLAADQAAEQEDCSDPTSAECQTATAAVSSDQSQVDQDLLTISQDQNSLDAAKVSQRVGLAHDRQTVAQAVSQVRSAVKSLRSTIASNRVNAQASNIDPALIAQSRASVTAAQVQVEQANSAVAGTVLRAPMAGTVISVSGVVGQVVTAGGNTVSTPQASSTTSTTDSSATGVVVISDLQHLELHAYFSETDTAKLSTGQKATATLNAISDVTLRGKVVQIDSTSTEVSNVVDYGVTIHLTGKTRGITQGQTANVEVTTRVVHNALYVSSAAVQTAGGQHTVSVLADDGTQTTTTVQVGVEGDQTTQIKSGLSEGDTVVISSGTSAGGFPTGGFPGGGGLGVRVGGGAGS